MIAENEPKTKLAAKPCADCSVDFAVDLLDDDQLCLWCELIRGGADPAFTASERKADEWLKANPGVSVTDEYVDSLERDQIVLIPVADIKAMLDGLPIVEIDQAQGKLGEPVQGKNALGLGEALEYLELELRYNLRAHRVEIRRGQ